MTNVQFDELIDALNELSDKEVQMKLWVRGDDGHMSSFTEAICGVFDDAGITRALEKGQLEKDVHDRFVELDKLVVQVPENLRPEKIIEHKLMPRIREVASQLLHLVNS